jgi:hypothetical protein
MAFSPSPSFSRHFDAQVDLLEVAIAAADRPKKIMSRSHLLQPKMTSWRMIRKQKKYPRIMTKSAARIGQKI